MWGGSPRTITGVDAVVIAVGKVPNDALFDEVKDTLRKSTAWATWLHRAAPRMSSTRPRSWRARFDEDIEMSRKAKAKDRSIFNDPECDANLTDKTSVAQK
jgi:hypothetical protein